MKKQDRQILFGACHVILLAGLVYARFLGAVEPPVLPSVVILADDEQSASRLEQLKLSIDAHMSGSGLEVRIEIAEAPFEGTSDRANYALELASEQYAIGVIWIDEPGAGFYLLIPGNRHGRSIPPKFVQRRISGDLNGNLAEMDTLAAIVDSALGPLLEKTSDIGHPEQSAPATRALRQLKDPFEPGRKAVETPPPEKPSGWFGVNYGLNIFNSDSDVQQVFRLAAQLNFLRLWQFHIDADLLLPFRAENNQVEPPESFRMNRFPVRLMGGIHAVHGRAELGLNTGFVLDTIRVQGGAGEVRVNPGFATAGYVLFRIFFPMAIQMAVNVDFFRNAYDFKYMEDIVIQYGGIQAGVFVGIVVYLDKQQKK